MKNIHVLATDKPSRLVIENKELILTNNISNYRNAQNIYITNSEKIKKEDWCFHPLLKGGSIIQSKFDNPNSTMKKIILTTDQDLIKDGVQDIPDEFLEWFVNNPSCEYINTINYSNEKGTKDYEIIIPKQ